MLDAKALADRLAQEFGLAIQGDLVRDKRGTILRFRPADLPKAHGFSVQVTLGWRSAEADFVPDTYAREIVHAMQEAWPSRHLVFETFARATRDAGIQLNVVIGGDLLAETSNPPREWPSVEIRLKKAPVVIEPEPATQTSELVSLLASRVFGLCLSLLPTEPVNQEGDKEVGLPEGAVTRIEVNRYERNPLNRAACIQFHGCRCKVCGFDFTAAYKEIGVGYIVVHHVTPVSQLGTDYVVDPAMDLVPLCPNCHAMVHRRNPPYSVDELKKLLGGQTPARS